MTEAQVVVAVVSWNTRELLRRCLVSMHREVEAGVARVCVVDNGSTDGSPELVAAEFPWVELLRPDENLGFGRAVNLVAARSRERWIAPANADVELSERALTALLRAGDADPAAGALAPRLIGPDGETQHSVHPFPGVLLGLGLNFGGARTITPLAARLCLEGAWDPDRARRVDWAHAAFLLVRRKAWDQVGGFDPTQWMYAEDLDLCWRLRRAGWRTRYVPAARVRHEISAATSQAFAERRHQRHTAAAYAWMERRRGKLAARAYCAANVAGAAIRAAGCGALTVVDRHRFGPRRQHYRRWARLHWDAFRERTRNPTRSHPGP